MPPLSAILRSIMTIDEMIQEAWLDAASKYTVDFGGSNFFRVSGLAADDFVSKHPEYADFEAFIAGAVYMELKQFQRKMGVKHEG